jgi:hypothetical protein
MSRRLPPSRFEILAAKLCEAVAPLLVERIAELFAARYGPVPPLLDAAGAAAFLGVDEQTVRRWARAGRIGCIRLGDGPRAPLRFDAEQLRSELFCPADGTGKDGMASAGENGAAGPAAAAKVKENPDT